MATTATGDLCNLPTFYSNKNNEEEKRDFFNAIIELFSNVCILEEEDEKSARSQAHGYLLRRSLLAILSM